MQKKLLTSGIIKTGRNKALDKNKGAVTMELETMGTKQLLYAKYRYNHCDGDCESCPCHSEEGFYCRVVYKKVMEELDKRG